MVSTHGGKGTDLRSRVGERWYERASDGQKEQKAKEPGDWPGWGLWVPGEAAPREEQAFCRRRSLGPAPKGNAGRPRGTPLPQEQMGAASRVSRPGVQERDRFKLVAGGWHLGPSREGRRIIREVLGGRKEWKGPRTELRETQARKD